MTEKTSWLVEYNEIYGDRIVKGKMSSQRIQTMAKLPSNDHAKALADFCRRGTQPEMGLPDPRTGEVQESNEEPEVDVKEATERLLLDRPYIYNEDTDTYVVFLPGVPKPMVLPGEIQRDMVNAYANEGGGATINELARTFMIPRSWVTKWVRAFGLTHDSLPFTDESILTLSEDDLAEQALQIRRASLYRRMERDKWREIQKDAMRFRRFETSVLMPFKTWIQDFGPSYKAPTLKIKKLKQSDHAVVICPTDFHWGKYAAAMETGDPYSREIAKDRLLGLMEKVVERLARWGKPKMIYLGLGSDFGHADTDGHATTKGTPQDMDGTMFEMIKTGFELSVQLVDSLRHLAPVRVVALQDSNHDKLFAQYQLHYLDAWYREATDVSVNIDCKPRQYESFGNTLIMFTHGDGVGMKDLPEIMAVEKPTEWGAHEHRIGFTGHRHYEKTLGLRGMTVYQLWSMAGTDRWHARKGYIGCPKGLAAHIIDIEEGVVGSVASPVLKDKLGDSGGDQET
jgi:hypothetical protein